MARKRFRWFPVLICGQDKEIMEERQNATFDWFQCPVCGFRAIKSNPQRWPTRFKPMKQRERV